MQIYTNSADRKVYLEVPVQATGNSIEVTIYKGDTPVFVGDTVAYSDGRYEMVMPFSLCQSENKFRVNWVFRYLEGTEVYEFNDNTEVEVVTPILPFREIKAILDGADDEECARVERSVRYIIQAHTGQTFGRYVGVKTVTGSGEDFLRLPSRLLRFNSINDNASAVHGLALRGNGWFLRGKSYGVPTIRADWDGWHETPYTTAVPISAPTRMPRTLFMENLEYSIDGVWGWDSVPAAVQEAARLLINDYACADANYRDRFLTSMTAADWRIQFHDGAFSNTGNVRANQLLAEYVLRRGWAVI